MLFEIITWHNTRRLLQLAMLLVFFNNNVSAQLSANFSTDYSAGCSPLLVKFTNTTTGASNNASYSWDLGNGNTSTLVDPGATYRTDGNYTVTLTVTDGNDSSSISKIITVLASPTVDFSFVPARDCLPVKVDFTAAATSGSGTITSYYWDFGDGSTKLGYTPDESHTYTESKIISANLTVTNSYGCSRSIQKDRIIEVLPSIKAAFGADQTVLCNSSDPIKFTDSSVGPGVLSYLWDFGDGSNSTLKDPSHTFGNAGIFTITLSIKSSEGCTATTTQDKLINIASFKSDFSVPGNICSISKSTFTNITSPEPSSAKWYVDGTYIAHIDWQTLDYTFASSGNHSIKLVNSFGNCSDSVTKNIILKKGTALVGFLADINDRCGAPVKVNFQDTTADAVKWTWNFGASGNQDDTNAISRTTDYAYPINGNYDVTLKIENEEGCTTTTTKTININGPVVTIKASDDPPKCGPYTSGFSATSNTDQITSYNWDFGDGSFSSEINPTHLFIREGSFTVKLNYTTLSGCSGTAKSSVYRIFKIPVADFQTPVTTICGNNPVTFNAVPMNDGSAYLWSFGDGASTSGGSLITHKYENDTTFTVKLIVKSPGGCTDTMIRNNYITVLPPFPKISGKVYTCNDTRGLVTFLQTSKKALIWSWNFGDGSSTDLNTDQPVVEHTYLNTGSYKVILTTTNGQCTVKDSAMIPVLLKQHPVLSANKISVCTNGALQINIANLEKNPAASASQNHYNFGAAEYSDGSNFNGTINKSINTPEYWSNFYDGVMSGFLKDKTGLRIVLQSAVLGCSDTTNYIPLDIKWSEPAYGITTNNICFKSPILLSDMSKTNSQVVSWQWNYGDSLIENSTSGGTVNHTYNNPGSYYPTLTITDLNGCTYNTISNTTDSVFIKGPKAIFNSRAFSYITLPVGFTNNSNTYKSFNTQYKWDFGDGGTASVESPLHVFNTPGDYTVTLVAKDPVTGCSDTSRQQILINDFKASFILDSSFLSPNNCPPILVQLNNTSINADTIKWDFGDGTTVENNNDTPSHIYQKPGKFIITLYAYGPEGLTGTFTDSIFVKGADAVITVDKREGCIGHIATFNAEVKNTVSYTWDFGDGTVFLSSTNSVSHQYNSPGTYRPFLVLTDSKGCKFSPALESNIFIRTDPPITFIPANPVICRGSSASITATGGVEYSWSPASNLSSINTASTEASPLNNFTYKVKVTDDIGCTNTDSILITVIQPLTVTTLTPAPVCLGKTVQLNASGGSFYKWIDKTNDLNDINIADPIANPAGTSVYTVTGTDAHRCFTDTATVTVTVLPLPNVKIEPVEDVVAGNPVTIISVTDEDVVKWKWSPSTYLNCTSCPSAISTPQAAITYRLTVTDNKGCSSSEDVSIKMQCKESNVMIPSAFSPNNDGLNDVFVIRGISIIKHMLIYNRWGNVVFEKNNFIAGDRSNGWDGTIKGEPQPPGTYLYFVEIECPEGGLFVKKGYVVLVK